MPSIKWLRRSAIEKRREIAVHIAKQRLGRRNDLTEQEEAELAYEVEQIIEQWHESVEIEVVPPPPKDRLEQLLLEYLQLCEQITNAEAEHDMLIKLLEDAMSLAADLEEGTAVSLIERALDEADAQRPKS
jgi:hypothetical protein